MKSYQQAPCGGVKKTGRKRESSPYDPYKRKARGKETRPGFYEPHPRPRGRVRTHACACEAKLPFDIRLQFRPRKASRYEEAGAAADELIRILGGDPARDRRTWAFYCYHFDVGVLFDKAHELASYRRQGLIDDPVTAFQSWLKEKYGDVEVKGRQGMKQSQKGEN